MTDYGTKIGEIQEQKRRPSLITGTGIYKVTLTGVKKVYSDQFIQELSLNFNRGGELDTGILLYLGGSPIGKEYIRVHNGKIEIWKFDIDEEGNAKPEIIDEIEEVINYLNDLDIVLPPQYDRDYPTNPKLRFRLSEEQEKRKYNSFI
jgi:hypothetical protein